MVESDILAQIRIIANIVPYLEEIIGQPVRIRLVIDACIVISDLLWLLGERINPNARTNLQELIDSGVIAAYAPRYLEEEVLRHFQMIADECRVLVEDVQKEWIEYRKRIVPCDPAMELPKNVRIPDENDIDYGRVHFQVAANAIYTEDGHFSQSGIPSVNKELVINLRQYARGSAWYYSMTYGGIFIGSITITAFEELAKYLPTLLRKMWNMPAKVKLILSISIIIILANPSIRSSVFRYLRVLGREVAEFCCYAMEEIELRVEEGIADKEAADLALQSLDFKELRPDAPVWKHALMILREEKRPLSEVRISKLIITSGYSSRARDFTGYVRRILREKPYFFQLSNGHWGLKEWRK